MNRNVEPIPADFEVQPLKPGENPPGKTTCGHCGLSWDDDKPTAWTPTPSGRCPFEYFHIHPEPEEKPRRVRVVALRLSDHDRFMAVMEALSQYVENNEGCEEPCPHQEVARSLLEEMEAILASTGAG